MMRTLNFVYQIQRDDELRQKIYDLIGKIQNEKIDILGWHLLFDQDRKVVVVTSNGTDDYLSCKFVPAEIEYKSLLYLIEPDDEEDETEEIDLKINYLFEN